MHTMTRRQGPARASRGVISGLLVALAASGCIDYFAEPPALPPLPSADADPADATPRGTDQGRPETDRGFDAATGPADHGADAARDAMAPDSAAPDATETDAAATDVAASDLSPSRDATPDLTAPDACVARPEQCNHLDDDCDGAIDEGFSIGEPCRRGIGQCEVEGAWVCTDDGRERCDASPLPPTDEQCNLADDDCDGAIDEEIAAVDAPCRTPSTGLCATGRLACDAGALRCVPDHQPAGERCDHRDDDCDGRVDEGVRAESGDCLPDGVTACLPHDGPCPPAEAALPISEAEVLVVPHSARSTHRPHLAHPGAPVTLKAIVRGAGDCALWLVQWDSDLDGRFDEEPVLERRPTLGTLYDIGQPWIAPPVPGGGVVRVGVRVRDTCAGRAAVGEMPYYITPTAPPEEPWRWTVDEIDLMNVMAGAEARWYLHRQVTGRVGTGRDATGHILPVDDAAITVLASALTAWILAVDGRRPGLPPWTGAGPDPLDGVVPGGPAPRIAAWESDPYAETTLRLVNRLAARANAPRVVPPVDETTRCGYNPDGSPRLCNRPPGTTDTGGLWLPTASRLEITAQAMTIVALSVVLPTQVGYPVPVEGPAHLRPWEWLVQQLVDALAAAQLDDGCAAGGWTPDEGGVGSTACPAFDWWSTHDALLALAVAQITGGVGGVVVGSRHRYRPVDLILSALDPATGAALGPDGLDFRHTATALLYLRDIGAHDFPDRPQSPFPDESEQSYAAIGDAYRDVLAWSSDQWEDDARLRPDGGLDRLWSTGDRLCGDLDGIYNGERCGSLYTLFAYAVAYYIGAPILDEIHDASAGRDHDWIREFSTYILRAQARDPGDYDAFGQVTDDCGGEMWPCAWSNGPISTAWAVIALGLPFVSLPAVPRLSLDPPMVTLSGCGPDARADVAVDWSGSLSPDEDNRILGFDIDRDAGDGLWWDDGGDPDSRSLDPHAGTTLTYTAPGRYPITLRTLDTLGDEQTASVPLTVLSPPNRPPALDAGGPYELDDGAPLRLAADADDPDTECGDTLDIAWDIDGDGIFADGTGPRPEIEPWRLRTLPRGVLTTITARATDSQGAVTHDEAALIIR